MRGSGISLWLWSLLASQLAACQSIPAFPRDPSTYAARCQASGGSCQVFFNRPVAPGTACACAAGTIELAGRVAP